MSTANIEEEIGRGKDETHDEKIPNVSIQSEQSVRSEYEFENLYYAVRLQTHMLDPFVQFPNCNDRLVDTIP